MPREINEIHVNSTKVSLNERFTAYVMHNDERSNTQVSTANLQLLRRLKQKHNNKIQKVGAIRRKLMTERKGKIFANKQKFTDLIKNSRNQRALKRLGVRRQSSEHEFTTQTRGRSRTRYQNVRSNSLNRRNSKVRGRSNSNSRNRANLEAKTRSNSIIRGRSGSRNRANVEAKTRSNSTVRGNLPRGSRLFTSRTQKASNRNIHLINPRSSSSSRNGQPRNLQNKANSVASRLGRKKVVSQVPYKGKIQKSGKQIKTQQSRSRVSRNQVANQRSASRVRVNQNNRGRTSQRGQTKIKNNTPRGGRSRSRNRNARSVNLNRETLDKELDQIMATSKMTI